MNKSQAEQKVCAFHAVFRVDVSDVKPFQNTTGRSPFDHFLDPQSMPIYANTFYNNKSIVDSNFAFIDHVSAVYCGGQAGYGHTKIITYSIITLNLL